MLGTADLILFAIQAGVKLAKAGRTIYVENTIREEIAFPLPATLNSPRTTAEAALLSASAEPAGSRARIAFDTVFQPALISRDPDRIVAVYFDYMARGVVKPLALPARERAGLAMIRQWESGDPMPSPLQRVAGTLVGIAVDYFVHVPGAVSTDSTTGKTLHSFLKGLDDVEFDEARWDSIVIALFTAGVEAINANPELFSDDTDDAEDKSNFVRTAVTGIASDLAERVKKLEGPDVFEAEDRLKKFGSIVLRSVLEGAGRSLVENPEALGFEDKSRQALVTGVGTAFIDLLLDDDEVGVDLAAGLRRIASTDGLSNLIHASLQVVAQHPDLISTSSQPVNTWLRNIVTGLHELYPNKENLFDPELLANVSYLVLKHGINDLSPLVLKSLSAGQKSLAVELSSSVLHALVEKPAPNKPAKWKFDVSRAEIEEIVSAALGAVASHPEWLFSKTKHRKIAAAVIPLIVDVIAQSGAGKQGGILKALVRSERLESVVAAVLASGVLEDFTPEGANPKAPEAIAKAVSTVLKAVTSDGISGLDAVLSYDVLHDVLVAVERAGLLDDLIASSGAQSGAFARRVATLVTRLRAGERLTIPEMTGMLEAA